MAREVGPVFRARTAYLLAWLALAAVAGATMATGRFYVGEVTWPYLAAVVGDSEVGRKVWVALCGLVALVPVGIALGGALIVYRLKRTLPPV